MDVINIQNAATVATATILNRQGPNVGTGAVGDRIFQTVPLNTIDNDATGIIHSLSNNQFTINPGVYYFDASSPAGTVDDVQLKIVNIDNGNQTIAIGQVTEILNSGGICHLHKRLVFTARTKLELQLYTEDPDPIDGFGRPSDSGEDEIYAIIKITRTF